MLIASNKSLAEYNLSQEEALLEKKSQLLDLNEQLTQLSKSVESKVELISKLDCVRILKQDYLLIRLLNLFCTKYTRPCLDCGSKGTFQSHSIILKAYSILNR
jgi:hypothetical protein